MPPNLESYLLARPQKVVIEHFEINGCILLSRKCKDQKIHQGNRHIWQSLYIIVATLLACTTGNLYILHCILAMQQLLNMAANCISSSHDDCGTSARLGNTLHLQHFVRCHDLRAYCSPSAPHCRYAALSFGPCEGVSCHKES